MSMAYGMALGRPEMGTELKHAETDAAHVAFH